MFRLVSASLWDSIWFSDLDADGKLLFLYLATNHRTTAVGAYEISPRVAAFETGLTVERVKQLLDGAFGEEVVWFAANQVVFLRAFYRQQRGSRPNPNFLKGAAAALVGLPESVRAAVLSAYPELDGSSEGLGSPSRGAPQPLPSALEGLVSPSEIKPEPYRQPEPAAAPREAAAESILASFLGAKGVDRSGLTATAERSLLRDAEAAIAAGLTATEVVGITAWLGSWRSQAFDLKTVVKNADAWLSKGRPGPEKGGMANGHAGDQPRGHFDADAGWFSPGGKEAQR